MKPAWTYRDIAGLTLPQARCILWRGKEPLPRVVDPRAALRWLETLEGTDG